MTNSGLSNHKNDKKSLFLENADYKGIFENSYSIFLIIEPETGRIVEANKSAVDFYQYPKDKLTEMTIFDINTLPKADVTKALKDTTINHDKAFCFLHKVADGSIKNVKVHSNIIMFDSERLIFSVIIDITDNVKLENERNTINKMLQDALIFNQNLIENASEGIVVYDKELRYTVWNNFMVKATNIPAHKLLGKHTYEILSPESYSLVIDGLKRALLGETVVIDFVENIHQTTGKIGYTREVFSPNYTSDGEIIGVVCIISDVTNIVSYQKSLKKKNEELSYLNEKLLVNMEELKIAKLQAEESDRLKSAFIATISHEIRTPLNSIVGFSAILKEVTDPEQFACYNEIIRNNNITLLNIIEDILNYSNIESSTIEISKEKFNVVKMLKNLYNHYRLYSNDNITVQLDLDKHQELYIFTDEKKLHQVITGLLDNALKFTTKGVITFGIKSTNANTLTLFVQDQGVGIPKDMQELIFNRFYKISEHNVGFGLGLTICKALIEKLSGKISLISELNIGSTFFIDLPIDYSNKETTNE